MPTISEDSIRFFEISSCDPLLIIMNSLHGTGGRFSCTRLRSQIGDLMKSLSSISMLNVRKSLPIASHVLYTGYLGVRAVFLYVYLCN